MRHSGEWRQCRLPVGAVIEDLVELMGRADAAIHRATTDRGGYTGTIQCPRCGGALHYVLSRLERLSHGRCTTPGCMEWSG